MSADLYPEPPELTEWAEKRAAAKAEQERIGSALCVTCRKRRDHMDHQYVASRLRVLCRFVEAS